jgi:thiol-disulfide isomerase/thioredoxin
MKFFGIKTAVGGAVLALFFSTMTIAQGTVGVKKDPAIGKTIAIKQLDFAGLRRALSPAGKPLLVNFWATWCDPCREEFPDLVKLDSEYKGKIDFITVSLDEVSEINRDVPKFLTDMKSEMPAFLLNAVNEDDAAIAYVSKDWTGALPLTILYDPSGKQIYYRQGKVKLDLLRAELDKLIKPAN